MAYSGIGQMGFIVFWFAIGSFESIQTSVVYIMWLYVVIFVFTIYSSYDSRDKWSQKYCDYGKNLGMTCG